MPTDPVDEFLRAEEEAKRLADVLRQLKEEIGSYKTAHEALARAREQIGAFAERGTVVAQQLGLVAETLRSIGTPELLRRLDSLAGEVGVLRKELQGMQEAATQAQKEALVAMTNQLRKSDSLAAEVGVLRKELQETYMELKQAERERLAVVTLQFHKVRVFCVWTLCLAAAAVILLIALLLSRG